MRFASRAWSDPIRPTGSETTTTAPRSSCSSGVSSPGAAEERAGGPVDQRRQLRGGPTGERRIAPGPVRHLLEGRSAEGRRRGTDKSFPGGPSRSTSRRVGGESGRAAQRTRRVSVTALFQSGPANSGGQSSAAADISCAAARPGSRSSRSSGALPGRRGSM